MKSISKILLLLCLNALAIEISGEEFLLDLASLTPNWLTYSCHYSEDYMDNWAFGCSKTEPEQDIYPEFQGFWTQCKPVECNILVDGEYLKISKMTIKSYFQGDSQIIVSGKDSINSSDSTVVSTISDTSKTWIETNIPVGSHPGSKIFNITLTAPEEGGFILVDSIFIEYELASNTHLIDLGSSAPYWLTYNCHYSEDYMDNWAYGCSKTEPEQDIYPAFEGFWTQCKPVACSFLVDGENLIISKMSIKSYFQGNSQIIVSGKDSINSSDSTVIATISDGSKTWFEQVVPVEDHPNAKVINITLTAPEDGGYILVDNIFFEMAPRPTEPPPTTTTQLTTIPPSTTAPPGSTPPSTTAPPGSTPPSTTGPPGSTPPTTTGLTGSTNPPTTNPPGSTNPPTTNPPGSTDPSASTQPASTQRTTTPGNSSAPITVAVQLFCLLSGLTILLTL